MSIITRIRTIALAVGLALVALVGPAVQQATAAASPEADVGAGTSTTCWYEYTFYRVNSTVYASSFKDCVYKEVPQPISFSVQALVFDEQGGASYWINWATGSGNIITSCPKWTTVRHSITKQTINCP